MRVIAPFDSAQGAMTLIALTALAVAIVLEYSSLVYRTLYYR
jgi:hypothetical protein